MEKDFDFLKVGMDNDITNNIPKEILIGYKKKINKFLSTARKESKLQNVFTVKKKKVVFVIHILFQHFA